MKLEPVGGAVPPDSPFYVRRTCDQEFMQALENRESILLVKGARQMGKTSLLAQGAQKAQRAGLAHRPDRLSETQLRADASEESVLPAARRHARPAD